MREKATYSPQNYIQVAFLWIKKYCSYQKLCHLKVLKICDTSPRLSMSIKYIFDTMTLTMKLLKFLRLNESPPLKIKGGPFENKRVLSPPPPRDALACVKPLKQCKIKIFLRTKYYKHLTSKFKNICLYFIMSFKLLFHCPH